MRHTIEADRVAVAVATPPAPLHTMILETDMGDGTGGVVSRLWSGAGRAACPLCRECTAAAGPLGLDRAGKVTRLYLCTHAYLGVLDAASAAAFSPDGLA